MWNLSFAFFRASENRAVPMILGKRDGAESHPDVNNVGFSLTVWKVVARLRELHGTNILTGL
jgi:hypothetical protein